MPVITDVRSPLEIRKCLNVNMCDMRIEYNSYCYWG